MKTKRILIAAAMLIAMSVLLSGCDVLQKGGQADITGKSPKIPKKTPSIDIEKTLQMAEMAKKDVSLVFESEESDRKVVVKISLNNPNNKPISSVQSWLSFDPSKLKGDDIDVSGSAFDLSAPYDSVFDSENGLMMLGRSGTQAVSDSIINVGTVTFEILDAEGATINTYDYREDLSGHTSVNTLVDGKPYNILLKPENPAVVITNQF